MVIEIYAVKDKKSGFFMKPFDCRGVTDAIRMVKEVANDQKSSLFKYAEDYSLFLIGKMDDLTGVIYTEDMSDPTQMPSWKAPLQILEIQTLIERNANA